MMIPVVSETAFAVADGVFSDPWLLDAALATAVIETPIFWLCGYRRRAEYLWFFVVNIVSNLLLNEFLGATPGTLPYPAAVLLGELFVVLLEYALCSYAVRERGGKRLFCVLLLTNVVSFVAGIIYFII